MEIKLSGWRGESVGCKEEGLTCWIVYCSENLAGEVWKMSGLGKWSGAWRVFLTSLARLSEESMIQHVISSHHPIDSPLHPDKVQFIPSNGSHFYFSSNTFCWFFISISVLVLESHLLDSHCQMCVLHALKLNSRCQTVCVRLGVWDDRYMLKIEPDS